MAELAERTFRVIGPGRAGGALQQALGSTGGWRARRPLGRGEAMVAEIRRLVS